MDQYILSLDSGTTSNRAVLFDRSGKIAGIAQKEFEQIYPNQGWVEHDPGKIWKTQRDVANEVIKIKGISPAQIAAIGITNQRETTLVWNRETGLPVYNAIVWQDRRTAGFCDKLKNEGFGELISGKTGLVIDAYFSGSKVKWILDNVPGARELATKGKLAFGTVDTWLVWKMTKGAVHVTDVSNASRTMLFNIHSLRWDEELLEIFDIPSSMLPMVKSSSEVYCRSSDEFLGYRIPVAGIAGDQQAALFGQMCLDEGMAKNTYGTGCFVVMNTGSKPISSEHNLLATIAWQLGNQVTYALEGSIFIGGAVVQWLRDQLGMIGSSSEIEGLAGQVKDNGGVYFVPGFVGLGAPHWDQYATGTLIGLTRGTTRSHIARAALEAIAFQTMDVILTMAMDSGIELNELRADGGAAVNNLLMQIQADAIQKKVVRPKVTETTALGAAYLAGLAVKFWEDLSELRDKWEIDATFSPVANSDQNQAIVERWNEAVRRSKNWHRSH